MSILSHAKHKKYQLLEAVRNCLTYSSTETEALAYIKNRTDEELSIRHYYRIKSFVQSDPSPTQLWLSQFTELGFVTEDRKHIDEVNKARSEMRRILLVEQSKPDDGEQDKHLISKLYSQIQENVKLASALNLGTPVVAQIKALIDKLIIIIIIISLTHFTTTSNVFNLVPYPHSQDQQQNQKIPVSIEELISLVRDKPFWIWDRERHYEQGVKTDDKCCFNHLVGLPHKDRIAKPLFRIIIYR
jgi:hypothetical protein